VNATVEAESVDAGVAAHCEMANDLTERKDFDHGETNAPRVAKAEHENRKAPRFRAVQDKEVSGATKVRNRWRRGTRAARAT
jgi:RNase P protein component